MTDTEQERIKEICKVAHIDDISDLSDGYHTFRQLYYQRMMLFAVIVKQNSDKAWKSLRHSDGELCFGGGWFIVGIDTPEGSYTYHYEDNFFSLFDCVELERGKVWDGHTEKDVTRLLSLEHEPCGDCISRLAALELIADFDLSMGQVVKGIHALPPIMPQPKIGRWILTQRDKYIDIKCSECGNTRIKGCAYGYTIDELNLEEVNDFIAKNRINYCEYCGAKMEEGKE